MVLALIELEGLTAPQITPVSLQALTLGRALSNSLGSPLIALFFQADSADIQAQLGKYGVSQFYSVGHPDLKDFAPRAWGKAIAQVIEATSPAVVLAGGSDRGNEVMAWVAALTNLPMAANCVSAAPGESFSVRRIRWGGTLLEEAELHNVPALLTTAPHTVEASESAEPTSPVPITLTPTLSKDDLIVQVNRREVTKGQGVTLHNARVVVGGGRGVGSTEGFGLLEELATLVNGAVGGSRVATNNGWRPHSQQVGLTGNRIAPELYIACGISGAIQHLVGCKNAKRILVINKDPDAPFYRHADYGVVGDLHEVLPALIAEIKSRRANR